MVGLKKRGVITAVAGILAAVTITGCSAAPDNDATVVVLCRPDGDECGHNVEPGSGRRQDI